jgi:ribonuclease BN (tRNA processing enzyme)
MTAYVRVVALDTVDSSPSIAIVTENKRFLIDCGEGIQRLCVEHRIRTAKIDAILLTRLRPETVCGLPGLCLTAADAGKTKLDLIGPSHTDAFWTATKYFMRRDAFEIRISECRPGSSIPLKNFGELSIQCIPMGMCHMCYVIETPVVAGKFDLEKAIELKGLSRKPTTTDLKTKLTYVYPILQFQKAHCILS